MARLKLVLKYLREVMGEGAYERYCEHLWRAGREDLPTKEQFYLESLMRRYSRPSRCC